MVELEMDLKSRAVLARMRGDGILRRPDEILVAVSHPHWESAPMAHDWRKHVPPSLRHQWQDLPMVARLCVFETAEWAALGDDRESVMVTGPHA